MRKMKILSIVILGVALGSCRKEEPLETARKELVLRATVEMDSRVGDTKFDDGDRIGVFVMCREGGQSLPLTREGAYAANRLFVYNGSAWTSQEVIYYPEDPSELDVYGYYPYTEEVASVSACPFRVAEDQRDESAYKASDFVWSKGTVDYHSPEGVLLIFGHRMSRLDIVLKAGEKITSLDGVEVVVSGVARAAEVNLASGEMVAVSDEGEIEPFKTYNGYRVLVPPQTVAAGKKLIRVLLNGKSFSYTVPVGGLRLEAGKTMTFTLTLNDEEQDLGGNN